MKNKILKIHHTDDLIVALEDLPKGEVVNYNGESYTLREAIPAKHKFSAVDFRAGEYVHMYGVVVGKAVVDIPAGSLITTDNVKHSTTTSLTKKIKNAWTAPDISYLVDRTFDGYHRSDGRVGTANHWLVIPLVFCENRNVLSIKEAMAEELGYDRTDAYKLEVRKLAQLYRTGKSIQEILTWGPEKNSAQDNDEKLFHNVDGIGFLTHGMGCGATDEDSSALCSLLAGYITHPNVAGATVLSLGCQKAQVDILEREIKRRNPNFDKHLFIFEQQKSLSEKAMLTDAIKQTFVGLIKANECVRKPAPLSKLVVGVECGGSDGFSGISANPAIGYASDLVVALEGTVILSEFPELFGIEQNLINRCVSEVVAEKFLNIFEAYKARAKADGVSFNMNASPGNIRDGLITGAIKSAGAALKGGTSPVVDALDYPQWVTKKGLNLLCTPGNDVESTTAMVGAGANLILFSTGLGTPTGNPIAPVIKVSSNSELYRRMSDIIDVNAGGIITGDETIQSVGKKLLEVCIDVASGRKTTKAMALGQDDFIPWKRNVSL